ncbi:hypothetical protein Lalb_Chr07g0179831 [Lupinus albus]|uniref:Uncharacterized protein n=1 Tax=Lupinus albus TaxID=3870 RepID=A0A6A4Q6K9_LUPAL|nr:hypothetical protein Lalb_Chr07g0179831 [Lupinus albus]
MVDELHFQNGAILVVVKIGYQNRRASVKFSPIWPIESNELKGREKEHGIDSVTNVDEAIREASESGKVSI